MSCRRVYTIGWKKRRKLWDHFSSLLLIFECKIPLTNSTNGTPLVETGSASLCQIYFLQALSIRWKTWWTYILSVVSSYPAIICATEESASASRWKPFVGFSRNAHFLSVSGTHQLFIKSLVRQNIATYFYVKTHVAM